MFLLLVILLFCIKHNNSEEYVDFHGQDHVDGKYPYIVGVCYDDPYVHLVMFCTGSLIYESWVLAAGVCVDSDKKYFVTYSRDVGNGSQGIMVRVNVLQRILHPAYSNFSKHNNIGLMKVAPIRDVAAFALYSTTDYASRNRLPVAYAKYRYGPVSKKELQIEKLYVTHCPFDDWLIICVVGPPNFKMDQGAQLVYGGTTVIGIFIGQDKMFTSVAAHSYWIHDTITNKTSGLVANGEFDVKGRKL